MWNNQVGQAGLLHAQKLVCPRVFVNTYNLEQMIPLRVFVAPFRLNQGVLELYCVILRIEGFSMLKSKHCHD
jgi:hypothetical protein